MEDRSSAVEVAREKFEVENRAEIEKYNEYQAAVEAGNPPELEEDEDEPIKPEFDEKYFFFNYDEEHPQILIPDPVIEDIDNDWVITPEQKDEFINEYNSQINEVL